MAHIETHALSVKLAGTFEAMVFFPEQEILETEEHFPVLWMIHEDGSSPFDLVRYTAVLEEIVREKRIFVIAPSVSHSLAANMEYGTDNEDFLASECVEIFRFMYPLSRKREDNYICGIHSGAYGAVKLAMKHEDIFGSCFAVNGELDIVRRCNDLFNKNAGFGHQSGESLKAVFGDPSKIAGSGEDLYHLAKDTHSGIFLLCNKECKTYADNARLAKIRDGIALMTNLGNEDHRAVEDMIEAGAALCMDC